MTILVLNCGSSSIKYQVIEMNGMNENTLLVKGQVERIGLSDGLLVHKPVGKPQFELTKSIPDHTVGINLILEALVDPEHGVLHNINELSAVGHRVAHGGEYFEDSAIVDKSVKQKIEACFELAPLHNPANLKGILSLRRRIRPSNERSTGGVSAPISVRPVRRTASAPRSPRILY